MYLSALELAGFKSFAKKTRLVFEPGITGIVGPNGSGKSAVADAIRWVLGEQSLKSIRAKRSDDVIFQGSQSRARLGFAEISLTLADADGSGLDTPELTFTRRIDRRGESTYLVNGRPVRLLDLAELLARSGFAQKSYTVVPQGMIDAFVTASPQERRQMFEDATGVTPLLLKLTHTERKLEGTRTQILRAKDLLRELEPRLRSVKRAAGRARSRAEVETTLRNAEEKYATVRWDVLTKQLAETTVLQIRVEERVRAARAALGEKEQTSAVDLREARDLPILRSQLERLRAEERDTLLALTRAEGADGEEVDRVAEEITARTKEREKIGNELGEVRAALATTRAAVSRLQGEMSAVAHALGGQPPPPAPRSLSPAIAKRLASLRGRAGALARALREGDAGRLPDLAAEAEAFLAELVSLEEDTRSVTVSDENYHPAAPRFGSLLREHTTARDRLSALQVREAALAERLRAVEERLGTLRARSVSASGATAPVDDFRERLPLLQREIAALSRRIAAVEDALVRTHAEREATRAAERDLRRQLDRTEEERATLAAAEAAARARLEDLLHECRERLGKAFAGDLQSDRKSPPPGTDAEGLRREIERLRGKLLEIGGIDASVIAEETVLERRVTEIRGHVQDLDTARKNLRAAMQELHAHIHARFTAGFRTMDEAFNRMFREVFGGGRASLSLVKPKPIEHAFADASGEVLAEAGAPAEALAKAGPFEGEGPHLHELPAGVEIHVHPPGKKLQSVQQLSGGEKALTSIALLFAILAERSSPFVVLDEVDAALDEANSRRFARLLTTAAARTQFIVVTHNRATMEAARALYGVTMGEDGVSQLLSITLEEVSERATRGHAVPAPTG